MSYHNSIMNIQSPKIIENLPTPQRLLYKDGHKDARHAAAEIALSADNRIEQLERIVFECMCHEGAEGFSYYIHDMVEKYEEEYGEIGQ